MISHTTIFNGDLELHSRNSKRNKRFLSHMFVILIIQKDSSSSFIKVK